MSTLSATWSQLGHPRVLVVGDLLLDRYIIGQTGRISPEAPVLILRETECDARLGGAANVASFLRHLEADVVVAGIVGTDVAGQTVERLLRDADISTAAVTTVTHRPTTEKLRFVGQTGSHTPHQLLRVDREVCDPLDPNTESRLAAGIADVLPACDAVILSDYAKGVLIPRLLRTTIDLARSHDIPVLVDPSRHAVYEHYAGATLVAPNRLAGALWAGHRLETPEQILSAAQALRQRLHLAAAVITLDRDGLAYVDSQACEILPGSPREVCDVTGAGDMVQAVLGLCLAEGLSLRDSLLLANAAAGLEVERFGVVPLTRPEIAVAVRGGNVVRKRCPLPELLVALEPVRRAGQTVVFTNGCFDLLHPGHVQMLQEATRLGAVLIVAINSDTSVRRLKGAARPVPGEEDRANMLAALACVDHVLIFEDETPHRLLAAIQPDILVKGGTTTHIVGRELVEAYGGQCVQLDAVEGWSTTRLIDRVADRSPPVTTGPV